MGMGVGLPPPGMAGVPTGTGQKNEERSRAGRSPVGRVSRIVSVAPLAVIPAMCGVRPAAYAVAPTTSESSPPSEFGWSPLASLRDSARSMVALNVSAVTAWPEGGENRKPARIRNVYVRPSADTSGSAAATSGRSVRPAAPEASG